MSEKDAWADIAHQVVPSIVNIRVARPYPFDTQDASAGRATGFVVDKSLGLICTNAHVSTGAPWSARATFFERKQFKFGAADVNLSAIYTDPVHDFAFVRYKTDDVKAKNIDPVQLSFADEVKVFQDICIMGNDGGEVISLLPGLISRVDRNPPSLWGSYSDTMTHYLQGSADCSGGSSGSPVINKEGKVVGVVAAGHFIKSTDFYLPVDKMRDVLACIRAEESVRRGTLQSTWKLKTYAECDALGLSQEAINLYNLSRSGLLSADQVLPEGPSYGKIQPGDILLQANSSRFDSLAAFENLLDQAVGGTIHVRIWRHGEEIEYDLYVQDVFKIASPAILDWSGNIFHPMQFLLAQHNHCPVKGVVMADCEAWDDQKVVVTGIEHQQTPDFDTFIDVVHDLQDEKRVLVEYHYLAEKWTPRNKTITVSRSGLCKEMTLWERQADFVWITKRFDPLPRQPPVPEAYHIRRAVATKKENDHFGNISSCMVGVEIRDTQFERDATKVTHCGGIVINNVGGIIAIPWMFCGSELFRVSVILEHPLELPATVVQSHALGYTIIRCDFGRSVQDISQAIFSGTELCIGDKTAVYGLRLHTLQRTVIDTNVKDIGPVKVGGSPLNVEVLRLETGPKCFGALVDAKGHLQGLWLPFLKTEYDSNPVYVGIPLSYLRRDFDALQNGLPLSEPRRLPVELALVTNHEARVYTNSHEAIVNSTAKVVEVTRVACGNEPPALKARDLILKMDQQPVTRMSDLQPMFTEKTLHLTVIRDKRIFDCQVDTISAVPSAHVVWALGATYEPPPLEALLDAPEPYSQVFLLDIRPGSPLQSFNLHSWCFITKINGVATKNLDDFVREACKLPRGQYCQISIAQTDGRKYTKTIVPDEFFPCNEARRSVDKPNTYEFTKH